MEVTAVSPPTITRGVKTIVTVTGVGFEPDVVADFDDSGRSFVCGGLRVELRAPDLRPVPAPVQLWDARVVSSTELRVRLEGDAGVGSWDLVVIDAAGREATLGSALDVTNCGGLINTACDDGEPCTYDEVFGTPANGLDKCTGNSSCGGTVQLQDQTVCLFACPTGDTVPGACLAGACRPGPGQCEPLPACTD
jgi:hypothetical protein